jgi:TRAP-type C4-dicarboxylate transport system permease small subunit
MGFIIVMMLLTAADVFMRYIFLKPIAGTTELTEYMMVCLILAMAWAALEGRHITVELVMKYLPKRVQAIVDAITFILCLGIYVIIVWHGYLSAEFARDYDVVSTVLEVPKYPFTLLFVVAFAILCLAIIPLLIRKIGEALKG